MKLATILHTLSSESSKILTTKGGVRSKTSIVFSTISVMKEKKFGEEKRREKDRRAPTNPVSHLSFLCCGRLRGGGEGKKKEK